MTNNLTIKEVGFNGSILTAAQDVASEKIYVGVRWVCEGIGLSRGQMNNETAKIQSDIVLSKGARNLVLPTKGGKQDVLSIEIDYLPLWLAKISITPNMQKQQPELTNKLVEYQLKAKDALAKAFIPQIEETLQVEELIIRQAQSVLDLKNEMKRLAKKAEDTNRQVDDIRKVVTLNPASDWRRETNELVSRIAEVRGGQSHMGYIRNEIYRLFEQRYQINLKTRLNHKIERAIQSGVCNSKVNQLNKLDVIGEEEKLVNGYISTVKDVAIKYGAA